MWYNSFPRCLLLVALQSGGLSTLAFAQGCPGAEEVRARLKVAYIDDMFVLGKASPHGNVLLRLAAFAASPHMVDEPRIGSPRPFAVQLAQDLLARGSEEERAFIAAGLYNVTTSSLGTARSKALVDQFVEACRATMVELAPKPPFVMALAFQDVLGAFDETRGGLAVREPPDYLESTFYTDFLTPKATHEIVKGANFLPMTQNAAEALFAQKNAVDSSPYVQSVAVVEVQSIDPELRVAEVRLVEYALFTNDFSRRLYTYPLAGIDVEVDANAEPKIAQPSGEGYYPTMEDARVRTRSRVIART